MTSSVFTWIILIIIALSSTAHAQSTDEIYQRAKDGNVEAQTQLGEIIEKGDGFYLDEESFIQIAGEVPSKALLRKLIVLKGKRFPNQDSVRRAIEVAIGKKETRIYLDRIIKHAKQVVEPNLEEAFFWYRIASQKNYPEAQANLAKMYLRGYGVKQNYQFAFSWATQSALQGNAKGQFLLAWMYEKGHGTEQNYQRAAELYFEAADQEFVRAQNNLGLLYEHGRGVERDTVQALELYKTASELGSSKAVENQQRIKEHHERIRKLILIIGLSDIEATLIIPLFDEYFSQRDIKQLNQFYKTPLGEKYSALIQKLLSPGEEL